MARAGAHVWGAIAGESVGRVAMAGGAPAIAPPVVIVSRSGDRPAPVINQHITVNATGTDPAAIKAAVLDAARSHSHELKKILDDHAETADRAVAGGAKRVCLVASGRGPTDRDIRRVAETVRVIKERHPDVEVCTSLGLLTKERAERLLDAGVYAYNHNLNTSEATYADICTTHTFADRVDTVGVAHEAGLSPCSGAIFGMGEHDEDIVDLAFDLRKLDPDSVPVNFLIPFAGTPLADQWQLTPQRCLRILALFRFFFPDVEVRIAGGRELHLRSLQTLGLHLANSIFLGDYLTSEGQAGSADLQMIADAGFVVEGQEEITLPAARRDLVSLRRRGPGTEIPANA